MVVDPSHGTGHSYLVPQMAAASVAAGADGLIIEVHPDPENALSDGYQSLTFEQFQQTMASAAKSPRRWASRCEWIEACACVSVIVVGGIWNSRKSLSGS